MTVPHQRVLTDSIARSAKRRYVFKLLKGDFEVFCTAGATRGTDGCEIWQISFTKQTDRQKQLNVFGHPGGG